MQINTKYNLGDRVWTIENCRAVSYIVNSIESHASVVGEKVFSKITYGLGTPSTLIICMAVSEEECFPTKEELIKSL